jgi:hypothetical protein
MALVRHANRNYGKGEFLTKVLNKGHNDLCRMFPGMSPVVEGNVHGPGKFYVDGNLSDGIAPEFCIVQGQGGSKSGMVRVDNDKGIRKQPVSSDQLKERDGLVSGIDMSGMRKNSAVNGPGR